VTNSGKIDATAKSDTGAASVTVAVSGVAGAIATATSKAFASAIDAGDGLDNASEPTRSSITGS
jgi:hypothetical protein